jgi:ATP-dependent RNA helicase DeaD
MERGTLKLDSINTLVLDEADEMISMGFKDELEKILEGTPRESAKTWLFSATMSGEVRRVADAYLKAPREARVNRKEMLSQSVEQSYFVARESDKPEILCKIIDAADDFFGIVFCQTKALVVDLTAYLTDRGYKADCLHGDMNQSARERTTQSFRERKLQVLVCTDVASRGLDVKDVTHVINYSIPRELDSYVHRIGRTARSGKAGLAMSLVSPSQRRLVGRIESITRSRIREAKIPTRKQIGAKKIAGEMRRFHAANAHARALELLDENTRAEIAQLSPLEVASRFLALKFPEIFGPV